MAGQQPLFELVMNRGPRQGLRWPVTKPTVAIGRAAGNDLVIDDQDVSRQHARLTWDGRQVIVEDLGSSNGTFVNGARISGPTLLRPGDVLGLAQTVTFALAAEPPLGVPGAKPLSAPRASTAYTSSSSSRKLGWIWIPVVALLSLCLCAVAVVGLHYYWQQRQNVTVPSVTITSPRMGARVQVGRPVLVDLVAYDKTNKITRLELWVDGRLRETRHSAFPEGLSPLPLSVDWRPEVTGRHTLTARVQSERRPRPCRD